MTKVFVGLMRLTSDHMFGLGNFWDQSLEQFIPNRPSKHVINSTNLQAMPETKDHVSKITRV